MAWEDELEPDWVHELPFYLAAALVYGAVFTVNPAVRWGSGKTAERSVPIEFVAAPPAPPPAPALAPPPPAPTPPPVEKMIPAPAPPPKPKARTRREAARIVKAAPKPPDVQAIMAESIARRAKVERAKAAAAAAAVAAQRRAVDARAAAAAKAEAALERAEAAREKAAAAAAAKAAKARKKAELARQLATMSDPDEALAQDEGSPQASNGAKAGAAAALADTAALPDPGGPSGSGGAGILGAKVKGTDTGPDGAGVSYSLDGPVGSRRVLEREVPSSPDWVGKRDLDLTVTVRFQVLPDGTVKPGAVIKKTSGFPEIDRRALDALRRWRFEPAQAGGAEVWGRATFRFTS